ncbi:MAG TPA: hydratase [Geminicoccus sp.]|jgi:2-keto-4-pentenoate hydratase|uniref:2-keto-4-pentenoate hydratase n=1 Tax=Geminicoccus sp. TaxID=2024832 RepID=UPI002E324205|nr:hydratase [Geminicoccus sp.]HEX2526737.1 hydratase [Geminicoccus sp.]
MTADAAMQAAADLLFRCWQEGWKLPALPDDMQPRTRADGYAVQAFLEHRSTSPLFGWKIAATSLAGQAHIGVDGPLAGRILQERVVEPGGTISLKGNLMKVAEAEFAFRMVEDLPPRPADYTVEQVMAAAGTLHPAIEVPDSRYEDFVTAGEAQLLADDACAHLFVLGEATKTDWRSVDLVGFAPQAVVRRSGQVVMDRTGSGANVLGDPRLALTWLANELSRLGITLRAGEVVTTGTCMVPLAVEAGDQVHVDFGELGQVQVGFSN